ncbi:restriction endonuclease [Microbacterium sp. p3-SID338]|uniref:restriction endonuclease n=1 Tax=Microbacterium sp. p3-SID338 TaxID=2916214 RepID=UPI0021A9363C|nr:restriction endonuclease [Microbacterium sp. p3-SID338]MCT1396656.1 restriction endonuclease [Microbacterium sp. p3-SID338]
MQIDEGGSWHTDDVNELEPEDLAWAEDFGARWGATFPTLYASNEVISQSLKDSSHAPTNERTIAHQKRLLGIPANIELSTAQASAGGPYLLALTAVIVREVQWALYWRRQVSERGEPDPRVDYLTLRAEPHFLRYLEQTGPAAPVVAVTTADGTRFTNAPVVPTRKEARQERRARRLAEKERRRAESAELAAQAQARKLDEERQARQQAEEARAAQLRLAAERERLRRQRPPAPAPQPYGVNHQGAERFAADWMRHLGVRDAKVTQYSGDGGIDVESRYVIAQVKNLRAGSAVPIAQIRDLFGTATHRGKGAVLFTSGGVSQGGLEFSDQTGIALIQYNAERGTLVGLNARGRTAIAQGFPVAFGFEEF